MEVKFQGPLVKIGKKTKRISLQRFLLSRIVYEPDQVKLSEWVCLFENQLWLERKCLNDQGFFRKFADSVFALSHYLKESDLQGLFRSNKLKFSTKIKNNLSSFLVPERNYSQWKSRFSGRFSFHPNILNKELSDFYQPRRSFPKRMMGIGYRDKGSRRNLAKDGSPDWRDVASVSDSKPQWEKELDNAECLEDIERVFVKVFPETDFGAYFANKASRVSANDTETTKREEAKT